MTGKELVLAAIERKKVERIPWVPFTGVHVGSLIGKNASEYLKDEKLIVEGLNEAIKRYRPDGIPVVFDLQIEAEVFGCGLNWSDDNPPAVITHPLAEGLKKLEELTIPQENEGRIPIAVKATRQLREQHPNLALYGLITGPFTLALHLLGTDIFMGMFDSPEFINKVLDFCSKTAQAMSKYYAEAGCDVIAVVDPMTSQIGPDQFNEFCTQPSVELFDYIRSLGAKSSFFVCGHAQNNIGVMTDCHCDSISIDENIPLDYVKEICDKKGVAFGGNMKLTSVMLLGSPEANKVDALECMELGGYEGFILAPGCDMPFATPPENVEAIADVVHDKYQQEVAKELSLKQATTCNLLDMSEYGQGNKVIIDIITLDSEGCAPCQYMVEAVKAVVPEFGYLVEWHEHKIKQPEAITLMSSLFVKNIPTICIDGKITFVSRIPPHEKISEAIRNRIKEKFALKIKHNRGKILLLGNPEQEGYAELKENINLAKKELGSEIAFEEINELDDIRKYGVFETPAVLTEKLTVKNTGKVAEKNIIKEWIKALNE